jgi:glycosyltransferase involved in cell wall biosynthesis
VGEYTRRVMETTTASNWTLYHRRDWRLRALPTIVREIDALGPREIFLQYPTHGYGWSLVPHLLCVYYSRFTRTRFTAVMHEYSQLSDKARWAARLILWSANRLIFTSEFERAAAAKASRSVAHRSRTIKIASNIAASPAAGADTASRPLDLVYFGHIRPLKGLESFFEVVRQIRSTAGPMRIALIGQSPAGFERYARTVLSTCEDLGIETMLDLPADAVAQRLAQARIALLPFPDGVSERRGTALAAMANGALVLTAAGSHTPDELRRAVVVLPAAAAPAETARRVSELQAMPEPEWQIRRARAFEYLSRHIPTSWDDVARGYLAT